MSRLNLSSAHCCLVVPFRPADSKSFLGGTFPNISKIPKSLVSNHQGKRLRNATKSFQ